MPASWTARGALLVTLLAVVVMAAGYLGAPQAHVLTSMGDEAITAASLRPTYIDQWQGRCTDLLALVTGLWVTYGARNAIPTPRGWGRTPTTAELRQGLVPVAPPDAED